MASGVCGPNSDRHHGKSLGVLYLSFLLGIVASKSNNLELKNCMQNGREWYRATLRGGAKAGNFSVLRRTSSMRTCKELCCGSDSCELALHVNGGCFAVQCRSADSCMPQKVLKRSSVEAPRIFVRDIRNFLKKPGQESNFGYSADKMLIREKRQASCHHYHGHICNHYLDKNKLLYLNKSPKILEEKLRSPFTLLKPRLLEQCAKYALKAICLTAYPYCSSTGEPKPVKLCKEDCEKLESNVCKSDFRVARKFDYLSAILPNCTVLPLKGSKEGEGCVTLGLPADSKPDSMAESQERNGGESDTDSSKHLEASTEHQSSDNYYPTQPGLTELVQSSQKPPSSKRSSFSPTETTEPLTNAAGLPVEPVVKADEPLNNGSFLQMSLGEINPSSSELSHTSSVVNQVGSDTVLNPSDQVEGNVSIKDILHVLPSPAASVSTVSPVQHGSASFPNLPIVLNVSTEAESEVNLAQSSDNTSLPASPAVTSRPVTNKTENNKKNGITTEKPSPKLPTTVPRPSLQVSAGEDRVLTLPVNTVSLYASAWPKETSDNPYSYHWQQISAPEGSHGYMEGQDSRRVILSQLDQTGIYQFKVKATGSNQAYGYAYINVTVLPAPRINKPPRADISPKEQTITLPTNEVVLDGSKSSDDDKIVQYKWEEVKGPLNDKNKMMSSGVDTPVLQLKSLVPGIYTFKLTVTDSDGESDSTTATVTVNDEKDYPPVARAGNDLVIVLPVDHVTLYANGSTDDKGIVSYEWSKTPSSPAVGDMQGTSSPILKVSNMVVGDYAFVLKVTDTGGQTASSTVTVVVQPEKNAPPVAVAGSDKDLVYPDDSTVLDASASHDDQKIVKYHWEQSNGPHLSEMIGVDDKVVTVKNLLEGNYVFKLTVTDEKGLTGTDTVAVNVKKDINKAPTANAGPDVVVHLPNRAAELDGSRSYDDHGIVEYEWSRDPKSPAAGDVVNNSDDQATLRLSNLVEGVYKFKLTVTDGKGLKGTDAVILTVKEDENSVHLAELYLDVDITKFTEENKEQLIRKLAVILDVQDEDIIVEHLKEAGVGHSLKVMFYVKDKVSTARDGYEVAGLLKEKIGNEEGFFEFRMLKVEAYICRNNCSGHGYCDRSTKMCVCESFWMQDFFKFHFGSKESNCDWSILYVTVIIFGIIMAIGGLVWVICFLMGRRRGRGKRRHHRYAVIDDDDDKLESMEMLPKGGKFLSTSLMLSDTDDDSDDESTVFEAKRRSMNGSVNGYIRKDT
ncbi:dyslexia-associated protein KIAA0319-like protein [Montipora capricornis]|uniref:dyslexia-associated protein KIAA0319-like protein n=1 Tax=Montipora capricornis TaxID=246305 RepID=UPI0035F100FA